MTTTIAQTPSKTQATNTKSARRGLLQSIRETVKEAALSAGAEKPAKEERRLRRRIRAVVALLRAAVILGTAIMVHLTVFILIPQLGGLIYVAATDGVTSLGESGLLALYTVPLWFVSGLIFIGEFFLIRGAWRKTGGVSALMRERAEQAGRVAAGTGGSAQKTNNKKGK